MDRRWGEAEASYHEKILDSLDAGPGCELLDVGCDDGAWTDEVRRGVGVPPDQVHGLELVDERPSSRGAVASTSGPATSRSRGRSRTSSFDVVHSNQVIEHVVRLDHFVTEIRRVLAPGGVAVVCTENLASWHNVGALALGYQPFSMTNVSNVRPIGNRFALHAGEKPEYESWQHVHVLTIVGAAATSSRRTDSPSRLVGDGLLPGPAPARIAARVDRSRNTRTSSASWLAWRAAQDRLAQHVNVVPAVVGGRAEGDVLELVGQLASDVVGRVVSAAEARAGRAFVEDDELAVVERVRSSPVRRSRET